MQAPRATVLFELGYSYLFIDGQCHYWVNENAGELGPWLPIHEGDLDPKSETAIATDFCYADWQSLNGLWGTTNVSDVVPVLFHDNRYVIACAPPCEVPAVDDDLQKFAKIRYMHSVQLSLVAKLYARGTAMTGPVRIAIFETELRYPGVTSVRWPLTIPIEGLLATEPIARAGTSHLIEGAADAQSLRDLRSSYTSGQLGPTQYQFISIANEAKPDTSYELYFRDAIPPMEDDKGLVPYPPGP